MFRKIDIVESNEEYIRCKGLEKVSSDLFIDELWKKILIRSKNPVYKVSTNKGSGILKLNRRSLDAERESWATNRLISINGLETCIPAALHTKPIPVEISGSKAYVNVQEDIESKIDPVMKQIQNSDVDKYIDYILGILVKVHTEATKMFNADKVTFSSRRLFRPELYDRIIRTAGVEEIDYLKGKGIAQLEDQRTFIHQDPKNNNRLGQYLVDWGNCGAGNYLIDLVRMCEEHKFRRIIGFETKDIIPVLERYWDRRDGPKPDLSTELQKYCNLAYLHNVTEIDCLIEYGDTKDDNERETLIYMQQSLQILRKQIS
jgi:hypothetical protein